MDDDPALRDTLERALVTAGYAVETATNGLEALSILPGWPPNVIVLDLVMPIMDGWRFRAEQRKTASADVPVVVLTSHWDAAAATRDLDAAETLRKPFEVRELMAALARILS